MVKAHEDHEFIWAERESKDHYIDDVLFQFIETSLDDKKDCIVSAKSKSQTLSFYDWNTNFCNIWNVLHEVPTFTDITTSNCMWEPTDPQTACIHMNKTNEWAF